MIGLSIIVIIICGILIYYRPSLDWTRNGWLLVWYGRKKRNFFKINLD